MLKTAEEDIKKGNLNLYIHGESTSSRTSGKSKKKGKKKIAKKQFKKPGKSKTVRPKVAHNVRRLGIRNEIAQILKVRLGPHVYFLFFLLLLIYLLPLMQIVVGC